MMLSGCDSGGSNAVLGSGGVGVSSGGGGTTTTSGTTGVGLTGGSGNFGGSGSGGTTGGTTTSTGSTTTTTTTTTTGSTGDNAAFLAQPLTGADFRTSIDAPADFDSVVVGNSVRTLILSGFGMGPNAGRLNYLDTSGTQGVNGLPMSAVNNNGTGNIPVSNTLTNPVDIEVVNNEVFITDGFDNFGDGRIIRISEISIAGGVMTGRWDNLTTVGDIPQNPMYMAFGGPGLSVYWSEYNNSTNGQVRRVSVTGVGNTPVTVVNDLNFPAGIAINPLTGSDLAICVASGGANGEVVLADASSLALPLSGTTQVTDVGLGGQQAIERPFGIAHDGANGFFFTEGFAMPSAGGPNSINTGGIVRFVPDGGSTATIVSNGLGSPAAAIDVVNLGGGETTYVLFSESISGTNGRFQRRVVDTSNVTNVPPTLVQDGLFSPLAVNIENINPVLVSGLINFTGPNNGLFRVYGTP